MTTNKLRFGTTLLAAVLAVTLTGCGGDGESGKAEREPGGDSRASEAAGTTPEGLSDDVAFTYFYDCSVFESLDPSAFLPDAETYAWEFKEYEGEVTCEFEVEDYEQASVFVRLEPAGEDSAYASFETLSAKRDDGYGENRLRELSTEGGWDVAYLDTWAIGGPDDLAGSVNFAVTDDNGNQFTCHSIAGLPPAGTDPEATLDQVAATEADVRAFCLEAARLTS